MAAICLITPGHLTTNPRLVKEADALAGAGHDVRVIAANYAAWARKCDVGFAERPWLVEKTIRFGPDAPFQNRLLHAARQRLGRSLASAGVRHQAVIRAALHPVAPDLVTAARRVKADLYIAHYPAALPAAAMAARHYGGRYAYDAEDFHLGDWPQRAEYERERHLLRAIEARYLPGCAYISAASPGIADAYVEAYGVAPPTVVLNVFPLSQGPACATPRGTVQPGPSLYWFSQTIGPDRGLECAVRAVGQTRCRLHLYLRGTPARGYLDHLSAVAAVAGCGERVHILPPAPPGDMERLAAGYDLGFVGETGHTRNRQIALTNKLFAYLLAGVPIVMSDVQAHRALVGASGLPAHLFPVDDSDALATILDRLLGDPAAPASARSRAYELGQTRFNWNVEQEKFLDAVNQALSGRCRATPTLLEVTL